MIVSRFVKILIGVGFTLLVLSIAGGVFLYHLVTKSYPDTKGSFAQSGLHSPVNIYRDEYGVPHIAANDEHDLMFAAGFAHAQDRLWQMDLGRRIGEGRLSELFDTATVAFDKLFRTLQFTQLADSLELHLHPDSRRLLQDYADGVNEFIVTHKGKYPVEFDMLNYEPEPWTVRHSLLLMRLMAWELNFAWWVDLTYAEIEAKVPPEKFREIFLSSSEQAADIGGIVPNEPSMRSIHDFLSAVREYRTYFHAGSFSSASNAWAVDGSKSMSGKPILANDPHLVVSLPSKWYEMHLAAPGWNVAGVTIPGIPLVLIGHNDSLAWGFTNAMIDESDFYAEQIDSLKGNTYRYKNQWLPLQSHEEVIYVGHSDSVVIQVRRTHHGPIVNDVNPSAVHMDAAPTVRRSPIALRWVGAEMSDEILGLYRINRAVNAIQFEEGLRQLTVPGQCAVYADVEGNIARWIAGRIPIRGKHAGTMVLDGPSGEDEWRDYIPFEKLPKLWNPPGGIIVSANQQFTDKTYPYYVSTLWEPQSRYQRIQDLLSLDKISIGDIQQFQEDVVSYYSRDLAQEVLRAFSADSSIDPETNGALIYVRNWDYRVTPTDIASTIINTFFVKLIHNTYEDELGPDVLDDFLFSLIVPYRVTERLMKQEQSQWFDDIRTDIVETKTMIVRKSLLQAIEELRTKFGPEMKTWQWGKLHEVVFEHPLGRRKPLDKVFNVGPFAVGGGEETVNKGMFKLADPFRLFAGPSMRQIVDLASPSTASTILTLGQSGQPLHHHYDDQTSLWLNGGYKKVTINWDEIQNQNWERLTLKPK
jgi:penicillin G amidase